MKLNADCVRDILLYIEENVNYEDSSNPTFHNELMFGKLLADDTFKKYNKEELTYALELLIKEHFIECAENPYFVRGALMSANIIGLTWNGYELLDNIRDNTVWGAVKAKAAKFKGLSISTLASSAKILAAALMKDPNAVKNFLQGVENIKTLF